MKTEIIRPYKNQLVVNKEWLLARRVRQFWNPQNHRDEVQKPLEGIPEYRKPQLSEGGKKKLLENVQNAQTIGAVRRAYTRAYILGAQGSPHQKDFQQAVIARKQELRAKKQGPSGGGSGFEAYYYNPSF